MTENLILAIEHLAGFVIVMLTLCLLWGGTALIGRLFGSQPARQKTTRLAASNHQVSTPADDADDISDELVAVYAAAAVLLDQKHTIVAIRTTPSSWGIQGRREIHASHRIR